jgi:hypothetical protein
MKRLTIGLLFLIAVPLLSHETTTTTVLFDREIVRILDQHCVMCHSDGSLSFPLNTYEQTWLRGRTIRSQVLQRHMPPWPVLPGYGQFANDNSLTLRELQFMVSWVEGLGPRNTGTVFLNVLDPNARPRDEVRAQPHTGHWQLGSPSMTFPLSETRIESKQPDHVRRIVVDSGLKTEQRLHALEYLPGDRRVVRAAFFTIQETGQWIGSWTPWYGYSLLPSDTSLRIPAGAHIVAEIHYRGTGVPVVDRGTLGFYFSDRRSTATASDLVLEAKGDVVPGATAQRFRTQTRLSTSISLLAFRADVAPGIQSVEVSARRADGGTDVLLFARDLQLDWPTPYVLKEPIRLAAGTDLSVTAYYANPSSTPTRGGIRLTIARY